jgi:aryl-alcohol dehydrogenase-like predicted oxidoreductase
LHNFSLLDRPKFMQPLALTGVKNVAYLSICANDCAAFPYSTDENMTVPVERLVLSKVSLGTMTWGEQTPREDAWKQLDFARDVGIKLIDAGEMYPIPPSPETQGLSEIIIGEWMRDRKAKGAFLVAGKVVGNGGKTPFLRDGDIRLDRSNIIASVESALRRLNVDAIDIFQIHWPDRRTNNFGQLGLVEADHAGTPIIETLRALHDLVCAGKVRYVGLSNETPWGLMKFLSLSEQFGLTRVSVLQNPYNLLNRTAEIGLTEVVLQEKIAFTAYSPLAFGTLSGKYAGGRRPSHARLTLYPQYTRYSGGRARRAVDAYVALARRFDMSPTHLAIAFAASRPFLASIVVGASTVEQLRDDFAAASERISAELLEEIERVHEDNPNPAP